MKKRLTLKREPSTETETMGRLQVGDRTLHTVEQEWRPTAPGGESNNSCVPAGKYRLIPYTRPNGDKVLSLVNHGLGVYQHDEDRPVSCGRYMILIHAGNTSKDVSGCIAPGMSRHDNFVGSSRNAMRVIMEYVGNDEAELVIHGSNDYGETQ